MSDFVRERVSHLQELIHARFPETKFKLEPSADETIWHFSVYTPEGRLPLPLEVTDELNRIWREQRISIITTIYSMSVFEENL